MRRSSRLFATIIATVSLVVLATSSSAQDRWNGLVIGASLGGTWADQDVSDLYVNAAPGSGNIDSHALTGGVLAGYSMKFSSIVIGVETDINWTNLDGNAFDANRSVAGAVLAGGINWSHSIDSLLSLRARAGFLLLPDLLLYGTGGIAWGKANYHARHITTVGAANGCATGCSTFSASDTFRGFVVGGGIEWAISDTWNVRSEFLHYKLDGTGGSGPLVGFPPFTMSFRFDDVSINAVRASFVHKFGYRQRHGEALK